MNRDGDPGSCAALAADLMASAQRLRRAAEDTPQPGYDDAERRREAVGLAETMETLASALDAFAAAIRAPEPPRSGLPHPHTALRTACERVLQQERQETDQPR